MKIAESKKIKTPKPKKLKFQLKTDKNDYYQFEISNEEDGLIFLFENMKEFPKKVYKLSTTLKQLKEEDECFEGFVNAEKFIKNGIKTSIDSGKCTIVYSEEEKCIYFNMKHDIFDDGYVAKIKVPEKEQDLREQVDSLVKEVSKIRGKVGIIDEIEVKEEEKKDEKKEEKKEKEDGVKPPKLESFLTKEDAAMNSFVGTSFLLPEEKILISKFIHPTKIIRFNLLYTNAKDSDNSSYFHYYCDGVFPTVTVVLDTSQRRFGGYSTISWEQSSVGASYARAQGSFIFSLNNKKKYDLQNQLDTNAVYRHNSYGPTFGGGHDLNIASGCKGNNSSYCSKSSYITGNVNLLGGGGTTNFQVSFYEVYQVIFE